MGMWRKVPVVILCPSGFVKHCENVWPNVLLNFYIKVTGGSSFFVLILVERKTHAMTKIMVLDNNN